MNLLPHILLISVVTVGAHLVAMELIHTFHGDVDQFFADLSEGEKRLFKPLFSCPTCMASVWGTTLHFGFGGDLVWWIPVILAVAFTNTLLNKWASN